MAYFSFPGDFHQLSQENGNRIKYLKVDAESGDEEASEDIIKGYEVDDLQSHLDCGPAQSKPLPALPYSPLASISWMPYDRARRRAANAQKRQLTIVPSRKKRLVLTRGIRAKQVRSTCLSGSEHRSTQSGQEQSSWPTRQQIWARCTASEGDEVNGAAPYHPAKARRSAANIVKLPERG